MTFRIAFVGIDNPHGAGWRDLLKNFDSEVEITAILPGYGGSIASLEERLAGVPRFDSIEDLVQRGDFEAAVVCLPNDSGPAVIQRLAAAGKHVLAEKPVAGSRQAAQAMGDALTESGVAFQSGYMWRFDDAANRLRTMLAQDQFGKLISIEMTFVTSDVKRRGPEHYLFDRQISERGFFNWLACHYLNLLQYVTQRPIVAVTARSGVFGAVASEVEDGGMAIIELGPDPRYPDAPGALVSFVGGYWVPRWAGASRWCLRGSQRWVEWDPARHDTGGVLEIHGPQPQWYAMEEVYTVPQDKTPGYGGANGVMLVREWLRAAREGGACRNDAASTLATLELLDTIYRSSDEGRRIECHIQ